MAAHEPAIWATELLGHRVGGGHEEREVDGLAVGAVKSTVAERVTVGASSASAAAGAGLS